MKKIGLILAVFICFFTCIVQAQTMELSNVEFKSLSQMLEVIQPPDTNVYTQVDLPSKLDWRDFEGENWLTPIKQQGLCNSCWAFASMASIESRIKIWNNDPTRSPDFSEQFILSCWEPENYPCNIGGPAEGGFFVMTNIGVPDEACFPYEASEVRVGMPPCNPCQDFENRLVKILDYGWVGGDRNSTNIEAIKEALLVDGPVMGSLLVYADFEIYSGGIYEYTGNTNAPNFAHAVTLIGWDDNTTPPCWIVKNSWGLGWGELGYFRIIMGTNNCGIEQVNVFGIPVVDTEPIINSLTANPDIVSSTYFSQMVDVTITADVTDNSDPNPTCRITEVTCSQSWWSQFLPSRWIIPEFEITGDMTLRVNTQNILRGLEDKIFTITVQCTNDSGNISDPADTFVTVRRGFLIRRESRRMRRMTNRARIR